MSSAQGIANDVVSQVCSFVKASARVPPMDDPRWSPQSLAFRLGDVIILARAFHGRYMYIFHGENEGTKHGDLIAKYDVFLIKDMHRIAEGEDLRVDSDLIRLASQALHYAGFVAAYPGPLEAYMHTLWNPSGTATSTPSPFDIELGASRAFPDVEGMLVMSSGFFP